MSSQNDETKGIIMVAAFIGAAVYAMMIFAILILMFLSLVLTVVCLFAWNQPRRIGKHFLMPEEARSFVKRGLVGALLLPMFCVFLEVFANLKISWEYLPHIALGGYALGSLGFEIMMAQGQNEEAEHTIIPPSQHIAPPPAPQLPAPPFRFASWNDEDGR